MRPPPEKALGANTLVGVCLMWSCSFTQHKLAVTRRLSRRLARRFVRNRSCRPPSSVAQRSVASGNILSRHIN